MNKWNCDFCGKEVSCLHYVDKVTGRQICDLCRFLLMGMKQSEYCDYSYKTEDGISLWIQNGEIVDAWMDKGMTAVNLKVIHNRNPIAVIDFIRRCLIDDGLVTCSGCGKFISKDSYSRWAGHYCKECNKNP